MFNINDLKFDGAGLIPVVTQDYKDNTVLMVAYMNKEAVEKTLETGKATYFSRSRNSLWLKGETSGHFQIVKEIYSDCDNDTLLLKVEQVGGIACHTGARSCFFNQVKEFEKVENYSNSINSLYDLLIDRKKNPVEGSYTNYLFDKGIDKILKKVGEESAEVIIGAKNEDKAEMIYEISDLAYHTLILLAHFGIKPDEIRAELERRKKMSKKTAVIIGVLITVLVFAAHYLYDVDYLYTHWILVIPVILFACIEGTIALYYTIGIGMASINYILKLFIEDREKALMMVENMMLFLIVAYIVGKIIERMKKKDEKLTAYQDLVKISSERDDRDKFYTQIAEYTSKKFLSEKSYLIFVTKDNFLDRVFSDSKDIPDKKLIEDKIRDSESLISKVINSGETFYSNFSEIDSRFEILGKNSPKFMAVPIEVKGKNIGLITVESSDKYRNYTKEELKNLHEYASIVGILAENMEYYKRGLYDDLLEIPGDRYIKKKIESIIEDKNKRNDLSVLHTIAMIDIDNFKKINEIYGAMGGDIILKKSVELFKDTLGEDDFIGRLSGNTFIIVLENKGKYITKDILEELRNRYMTTEMYIRERKVKMTFSASIISLPMDPVDSYDEARDLLEKRLFRAKLTGKNFILEY